ncbi:MAG: PHP domain-containing protein [bacterium]|nr:PHP domain-containing protein [bacterium]
MKQLNHLLADLHGHSIYSDGLCTPSQVVESAIESGLTVVALTDHNTTLGLQEFETKINECRKQGKDIIGIFGMEVSTQKGHLLFLFDNKTDAIEFGRYIKVGHDQNNFDEVVTISEKYNPFILIPHPEIPHVSSFTFDDIDYVLSQYAHLIGSIGIEAINGLSKVVMPSFMLKKHKQIVSEHKNRGWKANLFGNSDFHSFNNVGFGVTSFETELQITNAKEFLDYIKVLENKGEVKINKQNTLMHKAKSVFLTTIASVRYSVMMRRKAEG